MQTEYIVIRNPNIPFVRGFVYHKSKSNNNLLKCYTETKYTHKYYLKIS